MYMCTRTIEIISMQLHCARTNGVMRPHDMSWHCIYYTLGCEPIWRRTNVYNVRTVRNSLTIGSLMKKTKNLDMYVSPYERYSYVCENLKLVSMPIDTLTSHSRYYTRLTSCSSVLGGLLTNARCANICFSENH